ncbi:MAG TPA: hypothetical protein VM597_23860, partial [Gemmataceae bacterium]|nr:hypothetical protein [Gemmataceae bacterium]
MPYFGGASLARLHELLTDVPPGRRTGCDLLAALDHIQAGLPAQLPARGSARQFIERATFADAIGWIGLCLAEALQYAHERGMVYLDLKPANILLAADGTPTLLDFHLARPPLPTGAPATERLGGTPLYLATEQARALNAFHRGAAAPDEVDGRADDYSLGLTLYQFLGGPIPCDPARRGFVVAPLPDGTAMVGNVFDEALIDNARTPVGRRVVRLLGPERVRRQTVVDDPLRRHLVEQRRVGTGRLGPRRLRLFGQPGLSDRVTAGDLRDDLPRRLPPPRPRPPVQPE